MTPMIIQIFLSFLSSLQLGYSFPENHFQDQTTLNRRYRKTLST